MSDTSSKCNSCRIGYSTFKASCVYCRENPNNEPDAMHNYEPIEPSTITMIPPKRTQGDAIRAMADRELAVWLEDVGTYGNTGYANFCPADGACPEPFVSCVDCIFAWLNSEVDDAG